MTKVNKNAKAAPTTKKAPAKAPAKSSAPAKPTTGAGKPAPVKDGHQAGPSAAFMPRRLDFSRVSMPMAQDNTRVARPIPSFEDNKARSNSFATGFQRQYANLPAPRQHYLSQAKPMTPAERKRADAQFRAQQNVNKIAQLDPFAAQVNGMHNFGSDRNPNWQKVGGSPLEIAATNFGVGGKIVGLYLTGKHTLHAIEHPSVLSVTEAAIGVVGTVGGFKHAHGVPGKILHGAHKAHEVTQFIETAGPSLYTPKKEAEHGKDDHGKGHGKPVKQKGH